MFILSRYALWFDIMLARLPAQQHGATEAGAGASRECRATHDFVAPPASMLPLMSPLFMLAREATLRQPRHRASLRAQQAAREAAIARSEERALQMARRAAHLSVCAARARHAAHSLRLTRTICAMRVVAARTIT